MLRAAAEIVLEDANEREASGDTELIRLCGRLVELDAAAQELYRSLPDDDDALDLARAPIDAEEAEITERLYEIGRPATLAGARAVAAAARLHVTRDPDGVPIADTGLGEWLALVACAFPAGDATPLPVGVWLARKAGGAQ